MLRDSELPPGASGRSRGPLPVRLLPVLFLLALAPGTARGQGFDSPLVPAGRLRLQVLPSIHSFDTRFGLRSEMGEIVEEEEPLGFDFIRESAGSDVFPELGEAEEALGAAIEDPDYRLRLGSIRVFWDAYSTRIPVRLDVGITDWLTVGGMLPFERRRVDSEFRLATAGANVGESPLVTDPGAPSSFLNEFRAGLQAAGDAVDGLCADAGEGSQACRDARDFLTGANQTFEGLETAYSESEIFHLEGSPAGQAVSERIEAIQTRFDELGVTSFSAPPPLASEPLGTGQGGFRSRFVTPLYGARGLPTEGAQSFWAPGDLELSTHLRILNLVGADTLEGGRPGFRAQVAAGAVLRLATAHRDTLRDFLDLDAQRGTNDVELHLMADLDWPAARLGARLQLIYGDQGSTELRRRIGEPGQAFSPDVPVGIVSWSPGTYRGLALRPRIFLTPELALGGTYRYYDRDAAEVSLLTVETGQDPSEVDVSVLERETRATMHHVGARVVFSTVEATRIERTSLPFELEALWEKAVDGSGGRTPAGSRFAAGLRVYVDLWGGS